MILNTENCPDQDAQPGHFNQVYHVINSVLSNTAAALCIFNY